MLQEFGIEFNTTTYSIFKNPVFKNLSTTKASAINVIESDLIIESDKDSNIIQFENNYSIEGYPIRASNSNLKLYNIKMSNNIGKVSGCLFLTYTNLYAVNLTIENNFGEGSSFMHAIKENQILIENSIIRDNAGYINTIYSLDNREDDSLVLRDCLFKDNKAF